jgi:replicative DNA helicase
MNAPPREIKPALPDAMEAEQALLGAIFINNSAYWTVAGFLKPLHFGEPIHREIFDIAATMISEGRAVNPVTVKPYLNIDQKIGEYPVSYYLARLAAEAVTVINAYDYGRAIMESWARRQLIATAEDLGNLARNMPVDMNPEKIIGAISNDLTRIAQEGNERLGSIKYGVILPRAVNKAASSSSDQAYRIPWFLPEINDALGAIRRGNLIGLMSDSGGGKTSFSLTQCRYAASLNFKSAFFSIEITEEEAALQAAAQQSKVNMARIDDYTLNTKEQDDLEREMVTSTGLPFFIVGFGECTLSDIRIKAETMVKSQGLDLIVIDHAKMITLPNPKDMFAERVNALYRGLKALAKSLNVAIVILIQRNDDWKRRWQSSGAYTAFRPVMGDAYGGGSIKQSLDVWFSLYRPEPLFREMLPTMPPERVKEGELTKKQVMLQKLEESLGKAIIINHKRRRGEPGKSPTIGFDAEFTRFKSLTEDAAPTFEGFDGFDG